MSPRTGSFILSTALLFAAGIVRGQSPLPTSAARPESPRIDFATVDKDASGQLSREEALAIDELEGAFDSLDKNRDRMISPSEFAAWTHAGNAKAVPRDPATGPRGSAGSQHMPGNN